MPTLFSWSFVSLGNPISISIYNWGNWEMRRTFFYCTTEPRKACRGADKRLQLPGSVSHHPRKYTTDVKSLEKNIRRGVATGRTMGNEAIVCASAEAQPPA